MTKITLVEAVTQALAYELAHDEKVLVLGEDVGLNGGVFRATDGLQARFGANRVMDTPLAESMIAVKISWFSGFETWPGTFGKSPFGSAWGPNSSTSSNPSAASTGHTADAPTPCSGE